MLKKTVIFLNGYRHLLKGQKEITGYFLLIFMKSQINFGSFYNKISTIFKISHWQVLNKFKTRIGQNINI